MMLNNKTVDLSQYKDIDVKHLRTTIREKSEYTDELKAYFEARKDGILGSKLPWVKTEQFIGFRRKEVSVWAGVNGHGKSLMLGHVAIGFVNQGSKVLVASLEMPAVSTLARMARQASRSEFPTPRELDAFGQWNLDKYWLYDHVGKLEPWQVVALCRYAAYELGITHVVIDSLAKCTKGEDDFNGQKDFVNTLAEVAKECDIHVHLVHHVRKSDNEEKLAGKFDLKGSGVITDLVDNVLIVSRNKAKERATQEANGCEDHTVPDAYLSVVKQRHGDHEGTVAFWFNKASQQYLEESRSFPIDYLGVNRG